MKHLSLLTLLLMLCLTATAQPQSQRQREDLYGRNALRQTDPTFLQSEDGRRIGDQVLLWQRNTGGWPKNIDMASPMTEEQTSKVLAEKDRRDDSTTDNNTTSMQMIYLARLYQATGEKRYRDGFRRGVEYLLSGQYANGGWPQFWPVQRDYQIHITYNDDAMVNTMTMLRDMYEGREPYQGDLCDPTLKKQLKRAFDQGIECILATQITSKHGTGDGKGLSVWCQQHDRETLLPAPARAYELPSDCPMESAWIVRLLIQLSKRSIMNSVMPNIIHISLNFLNHGIRIVGTNSISVWNRRDFQSTGSIINFALWNSLFMSTYSFSDCTSFERT